MSHFQESPKRTRLQALKSEILEDTLGPLRKSGSSISLVGCYLSKRSRRRRRALVCWKTASFQDFLSLTSVPSIHLCCAEPVQQLGLDSGKEGVGGH